MICGLLTVAYALCLRVGFFLSAMVADVLHAVIVFFLSAINPTTLHHPVVARGKANY